MKEDGLCAEKERFDSVIARARSEDVQQLPCFGLEHLQTVGDFRRDDAQFETNARIAITTDSELAVQLVWVVRREERRFNVLLNIRSDQLIVAYCKGAQKQ